MANAKNFTPHIMMASPEIVPFAKSGGLADVVGALSKALARLGLKVSMVMPAYRQILRSGLRFEEIGKFSVPVSTEPEEGTLLKAKAGEGVNAYFVRADKYFDRDSLYGTPAGDYPDNASRFVFFARAILEVAKLDQPDILHCHDWQSALAIAFLRTQPEEYDELCSMKTAITIHNMGYQGLFWGQDWHLLNLDPKFFTPKYLEFYGKINFLKGGLVFADAVTTVSPSYAEEIKTPEQGFGLDGVLRERAANLTGIMNGADYEVWSPETDRSIARKYDSRNRSGKNVCKAAIQKIFGLPQDPKIPVIGIVSRLAAQKGLDIIQESLPELFQRDVQLIIAGTGDKVYQEYFSLVPAKYPDKAGVKIVFDEALAHQITAGADFFLMPSRYEPSGLNQLYSLKYGTIPIVRATGGLKDTVEDFNPRTGKGTGFVFGPYEVPAFLEAIDRALAVYHKPKAWGALTGNAMSADFSWDRSAQGYIGLYRKLLGR